MAKSSVSVFFGDEDQELLQKIIDESKKLHVSRSSYIKMMLSKGLTKEKEPERKGTMGIMPNLMADL